MSRRKLRPRRREVAGRRPVGGAPSSTALFSRAVEAIAVSWRAAVVAVVATLTYWNSLSAPFVGDDRLSVLENQQIRNLWPLGPVLIPGRELPTAGRPLVNLSLAINYAIGGLDVRGYHVWNVAVHVGCALILFGIVRRTLELPCLRAIWGERARDVALAASLVWMLHPLNTEAVDYITQRTESMMALCFLLTLYASIRALDGRRGRAWSLASVLSCAAGMACKESMVAAPLVVVLYDRIFRYRSLGEAVRQRGPFYTALAAMWLELIALLWSGPRIHSAGFSTDVSPWTYLLNQSMMIVRYLRLAVCPSSLVINYGPPVPATLASVAPYAVVVLALLGASATALVFRPKLGFPLAWFFITLAPTTTIVPIATEVGAERRMYLPLMALVVLAVVCAGAIWDQVKRRWPALASNRAARLAGAAALAFVALPLAAGTIARNREYASGLTLARTTLERWPTSVAQYMVGSELIASGRPEEALPYLRSALPGYPRARYTLGAELFREGKLDQAIEELQMFTHERPLLLEAVSAREMMGRAFALQEQWPQAVEQFSLLLQMTPTDLEAQLLLADALLAEQHYDEAIVHYSQYLRVRPADAEALTNLGIASHALGRLDDAVAAFRQTTVLNPASASAHENLATALYDQGQIDAAAIEAQKAAALAPQDGAAYDLLGRTLALQGKFEEAIAAFERAMRADSPSLEAREDLEKVRRLAPSQARPRP
jgi:protein O-mannosyl-transferase